MYERRYKISVFDPNRILTIKGKEVRTPTEAIVNESELNIIKSSLISSGSKNFVVKNIDESFLYSFPEIANQEIVSLAEKVHVSLYDEVKAKLTTRKISTVKNKEVRPIQISDSVRKEVKKDPPLRTSFYIPMELRPDSKNFLLSQVPIEKQDFEIKIENLKVESDNILRKLMKEKIE